MHLNIGTSHDTLSNTDVCDFVKTTHFDGEGHVNVIKYKIIQQSSRRFPVRACVRACTYVDVSM